VRRYDAVLLDAFGTLVELDRPYERLREAVRRGLGAEVSLERAERAFRAEMSYYMEHCHEGRDADALRELRARCARIVLDGLGLDGDPERAAETLLESIAFRVFDDVRPALEGIRRSGLRLAVVSNWDCSLAATLASLGLRFDAVVDSARAGSSKPDTGIFLEAASALAVEPRRALHVGDTRESDGAGARAAGMDVRILDRAGADGGDDTIVALTDIVPLLL
jgi:putative hydrolase of the HAD superfamily